MKTIAFFGHRRIYNKSTVKEKLLEVLHSLIPQGYSKLLIGCHGDFDELALSTCLNYRKNFDKEIDISVVLTSFTFLKKDELGCSKVDYYKNKNCETLFYDIENVYYKNRITVSNRKMVDNSDLIICYVDTTSYKSGAKNAISYAIKQNKPIINLFNKEDMEIFNL